MGKLNIQFYRQLIFDVDNAPTSNEKQTALDALTRYLSSLVGGDVRFFAGSIDDLRMITSFEQLRDLLNGTGLAADYAVHTD